MRYRHLPRQAAVSRRQLEQTTAPAASSGRRRAGGGPRNKCVPFFWYPGKLWAMQCYVYKSLARREVYVFLDRRDDFSRLPRGLRELLGELRFVVDFELTPERKLARESAAQVLLNLGAQGYHLQMPDPEAPASERAH